MQITIEKRQCYHQEGTFPVKLHQMLEAVSDSSEMSHYASWDPDGRSFTIADPKEFTDKIMSHFFNQTKYKSFQRQLNFYGFYRTCRGKIRGVYSHPLFQRNQPALCNHMKRLDSRDHKEGTTSSNKTLRMSCSSLHQLPKEITINGPRLQPTESNFSKPVFTQSEYHDKSLNPLPFPTCASSPSHLRTVSVKTATTSEESSSCCDSSIGTIDILLPVDNSWEFNGSFGDDFFQAL
ncbi:unnamed protein product [Cylindrotheca closterium]|uniref:HSF-type DNA-binding domain-containing protein n=1 Tax=Cylindrotheca closterium TaxID=2856 RepID=A0AAD2CQX1_9STRA|nr:unnamed protein product [Cylindrotheca closterium]